MAYFLSVHLGEKYLYGILLFKNFMEYHNGYNSGSWHKRGDDDLKPLTEKEAISILQWLADEYINAPIYDILIKINKLPI